MTSKVMTSTYAISSLLVRNIKWFQPSCCHNNFGQRDVNWYRVIEQPSTALLLRTRGLHKNIHNYSKRYELMH